MTALRLSGSVALILLAVSSAHAATVQEVFKKFDLLGNWALDCSKPASPQNPYITHRAFGDRVQRGPMTDPASQPAMFVVDQAAEGKPNEVAFSFLMDAKNHANLVVRVEGKRMRTMERTHDNGEKPISDGRQTADGRETPWFNKCN
jgi:hypothetical protein